MPQARFLLSNRAVSRTNAALGAITDGWFDRESLAACVANRGLN